MNRPTCIIHVACVHRPPRRDRHRSLDRSVGASFDNALAETTIGLFKTELHRNPAALADNGGPWSGLDDIEIADGSRGSTTNGFTGSSTTRPPPKSKPLTIITSLIPARHENQELRLHETRGTSEPPSNPGRFTVAFPISVALSVKQNSPELLPPSWPTRSISMKPGRFSSQSAHVRIGIWDFNKVPGLVWGSPVAPRVDLSARSIVAALIIANTASKRRKLGEATMPPTRRF